MGLRKFEEFENNLKEEDKNELANDFKSASRDLVSNSDKITDIIRGSAPDEVIIKISDEFQIVVKVKGYLV